MGIKRLSDGLPASRGVRAAGAALMLASAVALVAVVIAPAALGKSGSTGPTCTKARWGSFTPGKGNSAHGVYTHGTYVQILLTKGIQDVDAVYWNDGAGGKVAATFTKDYNSQGQPSQRIYTIVPDGAATGPIFLYHAATDCYLASPRNFKVIQSS